MANAWDPWLTEQGFNPTHGNWRWWDPVSGDIKNVMQHAPSPGYQLQREGLLQVLHQ